MARQTATWTAKYILAGRAIFEEYRAVDEEGTVVVFGANLRAYDAENAQWVMYWYDALSATLSRLGPPELGGVTVTEESISFKFRIGDALTRARFEDITHDHFVWHGDVSPDDGETWREDTIIVEASRVQE